MFSRPGQHSGHVPQQPRVCQLCGGDMAITDFHGACIVCLGVKHAFDAVYSPGGPQACPACELFSAERLKVRLENARQWCPPPATEAHSDPAPRWFRGQSMQHNSTTMACPGNTIQGMGAPRASTSGVCGGSARSHVNQSPSASTPSSSQSTGQTDEGPAPETRRRPHDESQPRRLRGFQ